MRDGYPARPVHHNARLPFVTVINVTIVIVIVILFTFVVAVVNFEL